MGVDTRIMLPANVRIRDVCSVIGVAVGFTPVRVESKSQRFPDGFYALVNGVKPQETSMAEMPYIVFADRHTSFHFEPDGGNSRLLMPRSSAFWCLVGQRLVDFFGGAVDYNDCDDIDADYKRRRKGNAKNCPEDGQEYFDFQQRILDVKPITRKEFEGFKGAAYARDEDGYDYNFDDKGNMVR